MNRRAFISLLGGAAAAWPLALHGQQGRVWRVSYLTVSTATGNPYFEAFKDALRSLDYVEGQNLVLELARRAG